MEIHTAFSRSEMHRSGSTLMRAQVTNPLWELMTISGSELAWRHA